MHQQFISRKRVKSQCRTNALLQKIIHNVPSSHIIWQEIPPGMMNLVFYWQTAVCAEIEIVSSFFPTPPKNQPKCVATPSPLRNTRIQNSTVQPAWDEGWKLSYLAETFLVWSPARVGLGGKGSSKDNTIPDAAAAAAHCPGTLDRCCFMLPDEGDRCNFVDSWVLLNFLMEFLS